MLAEALLWIKAPSRRICFEVIPPNKLAFVDWEKGLTVPLKVKVTATSDIPLWYCDAEGCEKIPCERDNPIKYGKEFSICGEPTKESAFVEPTMILPNEEKWPFSNKGYKGTVIGYGAQGTIHINLDEYLVGNKITFATSKRKMYFISDDYQIIEESPFTTLLYPNHHYKLKACTDKVFDRCFPVDIHTDENSNICDADIHPITDGKHLFARNGFRGEYEVDNVNKKVVFNLETTKVTMITNVQRGISFCMAQLAFGECSKFPVTLFYHYGWPFTIKVGREELIRLDGYDAKTRSVFDVILQQEHYVGVVILDIEEGTLYVHFTKHPEVTTKGSVDIAKSIIPHEIYLTKPSTFRMHIENTSGKAARYRIRLTFTGIYVSKEYEFTSDWSEMISPKESTKLGVEVTLPEDAIPVGKDEAVYDIKTILEANI